MLTLSSDPQRARQELNGLITYLTTMGYIDGELDAKEMSWVLSTIRELVEQRVDAKGLDDRPALREELSERMLDEAESVFQATRKEIALLFEQSIEQGESQESFVTGKLKQKCFEIFRSFDPERQALLIRAADDLLLADGAAHPAEVRFREELTELLQAPADILLVPDEQPARIEFVELDEEEHGSSEQEIFSRVEVHYPKDDDARRAMLASDRALVVRALELLTEQRSTGSGRLTGKRSVDDLEPGSSFLDDYVYVLQPTAEARYELIVIGDLHGCYSNLKAALVQSRFLEKLEAHRADPTGAPEPKLLLLGDYIDRGHLSFEGTVRLALELFTTYPNSVYLLRGNHEFFTEYQGSIVSTVVPAEALSRLRQVGGAELAPLYQNLFDNLPCSMFFGRILLTHAGIPMDAVTRENLVELAGLNEWLVRFQMMWSDPSAVDVMPRKLQDTTYRFAFGRLQCRSFLQRLGCHTLIRGHEHLPLGFNKVFEDEHLLAMTVFSSGGPRNADLPIDADLRGTTPKALTLTNKGDRDEATTVGLLSIDYQRYNEPEHNRFYAVPPEFPFLVEGGK